MNPWDLACYVRFQAFPFIENGLKHRPIRQIMEMDVGHPVFQNITKIYLENNQFVQFCRVLTTIRHKKFIHNPIHGDMDFELLETFFWEESDEKRARRILALLQFPTSTYPHIWSSGTNLFLAANSAEEKDCVLTFLEAFVSDKV